MLTDNKKLVKKIKSIFSASDEAKKIVLQELSKIDEKYKILAEKEKASLNETLKFLDAQLALYGPMLADEETSEEVEEQKETVTEDTPEVVAVDTTVDEEQIVDTLFEENNTVEEEAPEMESTSTSEEEWIEAEEELESESVEETEEEAVIDSEDGWPELPEEWK